MNADDIETTLRARASFDASVERIDRDTRQRLRAARVQALDAGARPRRARWMWPVGMATAAAVALAAFMPLLPHAPARMTAAPRAIAVAHPSLARSPEAIPDTALSADTADTAALETGDPDMLSDLEFYGWLAQQPGKDPEGG